MISSKLSALCSITEILTIILRHRKLWFLRCSLSIATMPCMAMHAIHIVVPLRHGGGLMHIVHRCQSCQVSSVLCIVSIVISIHQELTMTLRAGSSPYGSETGLTFVLSRGETQWGTAALDSVRIAVGRDAVTSRAGDVEFDRGSSLPLAPQGSAPDEARERSHREQSLQPRSVLPCALEVAHSRKLQVSGRGRGIMFRTRKSRGRGEMVFIPPPHAQLTRRAALETDQLRVGQRGWTD